MNLRKYSSERFFSVMLERTTTTTNIFGGFRIKADDSQLPKDQSIDSIYSQFFSSKMDIGKGEDETDWKNLSTRVKARSPTV